MEIVNNNYKIFHHSGQLGNNDIHVHVRPNCIKTVLQTRWESNLMMEVQSVLIKKVSLYMFKARDNRLMKALKVLNPRHRSVIDLHMQALMILDFMTEE